ncbi:hypothetical protein RclHR1_00160037 [Rhizophagus clarus]|uniref:Carbohydrate-binding module family 13 protein n=1 Tax=Rhizophagus clarus TaxID=94130 RepID=A0A2Z6QX60_9GLOM|nr:hypothetical protein RclHR1_00160037 [Rhizophagus clarus]GES81077.1 carbohydrate-binding module family 13 protein [Rhizophagus clarus]
MTNYYWIIAQHSGKVLDVEGCSTNDCARIIQYTKKSEDDPTVDNQLWFFDGGFIINKNSGLVLDVCGENINNCTQIIQYTRFPEPIRNQEWDYNYEDNTIRLRSNRNFVLDVTEEKQEDVTPIILFENNYGLNQKFTLQKWDYTSGAENVNKLVTNITDNCMFLPKLSQNLLEILKDDEFYDVTIEVGIDPDVKIFRAHMAILSYRSSYLRAILSVDRKKNNGNLAHIKLPNILPKIFEIILGYIYGGKFSLKKYDISDIIKLLVAANELNLQELIIYIQSFLIENEMNWIEQHFNVIYRTSFGRNSFLELQKCCNDLISKEPGKIFKSLDFTEIPEKLLISVIQKNNLQMSEIQIWEHVLKWGIAQNPGLPSNVADYSKEDFETLRNILQGCIPFIRFHNLTSKEYLDGVQPYKKVLPKNLRADLLRDFLGNNNNTSSKSIPRISKVCNSKNFDSEIITSQHVEAISKWIKRLGTTDKLTDSIEFRLLFRGTRDGFYPVKFHEICDNQSHTVTIVKVAGSTEILGGYSPIAWKTDNIYGTTKDSFIFSFNNYTNENRNYILSRVMDSKYAIDNRCYCGPSFGDGDLIIWGFDPHTLHNYCCSSKNSYEKPIRKTDDRFSIEEYEIFRLIFKS